MCLDRHYQLSTDLLSIWSALTYPVPFRGPEWQSMLLPAALQGTLDPDHSYHHTKSVRNKSSPNTF
jgi:hypothetical protein